MTVGGLEMVLGVVWGEHWRAVLLVVRGQWTCNGGEVREAGGEAGAADQARFMDTHGGAGDGFTRSQAQMGPDVRLQADNDWQGEQFAHIAARPAVCAMQLLLTYSGGLLGGNTGSSFSGRLRRLSGCRRGSCRRRLRVRIQWKHGAHIH